MRRGLDGKDHPTPDDPIVTEGLLHIALCRTCQDNFDSGVINYAVSVYQAMDRYSTAMEGNPT